MADLKELVKKLDKLARVLFSKNKRFDMKGITSAIYIGGGRISETRSRSAKTFEPGLYCYDDSDRDDGYSLRDTSERIAVYNLGNFNLDKYFVSRSENVIREHGDLLKGEEVETEETKKRNLADSIVEKLLKLTWDNVSAKRKELPGVLGFFGDDGDTRIFQTLNSIGDVLFTVEFCKMRFDEGPFFGSIYSISGVLYDANGNIIQKTDDLCDVKGRVDYNVPLAHLHKKLWNSVPTPPLKKQGLDEKEKIRKELESLHKKLTKELTEAGWLPDKTCS